LLKSAIFNDQFAALLALRAGDTFAFDVHGSPRRFLAIGIKGGANREGLRTTPRRRAGSRGRGRKGGI